MHTIYNHCYRLCHARSAATSNFYVLSDAELLPVVQGAMQPAATFHETGASLIGMDSSQLCLESVLGATQAAARSCPR